MKKQNLQSLQLNRKLISHVQQTKIIGAGHTQLWTNCVTACLLTSCHVSK
jgi:hypothetical protein